MKFKTYFICYVKIKLEDSQKQKTLLLFNRKIIIDFFLVFQLIFYKEFIINYFSFTQEPTELNIL